MSLEGALPTALNVHQEWQVPMGTKSCLIGLVVVISAVLAGPAWAVELGAYDLRREGSAARAPNPAQGFDALIGAEQVRVRPHNGGWEFDLALVKVGRESALGEVEAARVEVRGNRAELRRGTVEEWYVNAEQGLEQGFTIHQRPPGEGPLVLEMVLSGGLMALLEDDGRSVTLLPPGGALAVLRYSKLEVEDGAGQVLEAWLEVAPATAGGEPRLRVVAADAGAEYPLSVDPLLSSPAWGSADSDKTWSVAWGDWDGDGDLDLAAGNSWQPNRVYTNGWLNRPGGLPETPTSAVLSERPGSTDAAFGYSTAESLSSPVAIPFTLCDEQWDRAWQIVPEYSLSGGGQWLPATGLLSATTELRASPDGTEHIFMWDSLTDGVVRAQNVVFRISVLWQAPEKVSSGLQRAEMASVSPPFRVRELRPIFADGFESGDTTAWSAVVP